MSTARLAGLCYVVTIVAGSAALVARAPFGRIANAIAMLAYVAVTLLFYKVFAPVREPLSRAAAAIGLIGCAAAAAAAAGLPLPVNPLAFFGVYCLLIGVLVIRSTFVARAIGVLMLLGGLSWLTFAWPPLARTLAPYNFAPGILAETALTVWLLVFGSDGRRPRAARGIRTRASVNHDGRDAPSSSPRMRPS